ncbi:MAG: manganese efflux pump [Clostridiales bacterium]|nr:manganese efflux pump [Clostridiales bacterium]
MVYRAKIRGEKLINYVALAFALSIDALAAAFAYGNSKVRINWNSALIVGSICSGLLGISLLLGSIVNPYLRPEFNKILCFAILLILGIIKLFEFAIKAWIRKKKVIKSSIGFSFASLHFILNIYADPIEADIDLSKSLSPGEAISLAFALSMDGLAAGFGFSLAGGPAWPAVVTSLLFGVSAIKLGEYLGRKLALKTELDLSWISGAILILLAILKLR